MRLLAYILTAFALLVCANTALSQVPENKGSPDAQNSEDKGPILTPPKLVEYIQADYPADAFEQGLEAEVTAHLDVDENGVVVGVTIVEPAGHGFDEAGAAAMYQFVFEPATKDGTPVPSRVLYRYTFFIEKEEPAPEEQLPIAAILSGVVTDMGGKPAEGASILLTPAVPREDADTKPDDKEHPSLDVQLAEDIPIPLTADIKGKFSFPDLIPGTYVVDVVAPGFKQFQAIEELVDGEVREVLYRLEMEDVLYKTVVRARRPPREVTRREVTRREITRIPGTGGDALRSIQNLPGMARAPLISGALIVRGSSPQDSQYYFDQMPVPLLYHFGGLTSIINSDLLERIDFFPGNYSVRYGGATGGVVEVYPRSPATDKLHAYVDADLWDTSALVEAPLSENWSMAVSGRRSYIDAILNAVMPDDNGLSFTVAPRYYDYQVVANYHPNTTDELQLFVFGSDDKLIMVFGEDVVDNPNFSGGVNLSIYFHQGQARWDHHFSKAIRNQVNFAVGVQASDSGMGDLFKFKATATPIFLRDEFTYDENGLVALRTGLDTAFYWAKWKVRAPSIVPREGESIDPLTADEDILETSGNSTIYRVAWYGEVELRPIPNLRLINGLRSDYYDYGDNIALDPRFVARYELFEGTTLKGGIGLFHQTPQDFELDDAFGNPDLDLINAVHYSLGVEQKITETIEVGVEGFFKDISNLVVSSEEIIERDGETVPERFNNEGVGQVYGLEFLLKHHPTDRFFGWISYTIMKSNRIDHPGDAERRFDFDQTHILTLVASLVLGRGWEAGVRFRLVTGNPETPIIGSVYEADSDIYFPVYSDVNSKRLPTFHQLDVRIDKNWQWKYLKLAVYIDVQNAYNQKNPEGHQYNYDYSERQYFYGLPVLPSFGFKLEY
ncbi:MAG: TonB family protein [Proteobacteria bacterium]|nr:TonB family protein [Pseudomonadota bacterium]